VSLISDFLLEVEENCALLGHYAASSGNSFLDSRILKMGPIGCTETSVRNYHYSLRNDPEERSYLAGCLFISERTGGADKSLAQPGRKQATATEDFEFHISYL
jgi:hypothetical protein